VTVEIVTARSNQRLRTRKDLLAAAARLMRSGRSPSLEEVAEEALVSRATAYRHFSSIEALLVEASLDVAFPDIDELFRDAGCDALARVRLADDAVEQMIAANEPALRTMLAYSLRQNASDGAAVRQNRRTPLIEAALAPLRARLDRVAFDRLVMALALIIGTEAMLVFKDVLGADDATAADVRRWAIRALVDTAVNEGGTAG
jgi:AcrR family transcriptional regulator